MVIGNLNLSTDLHVNNSSALKFHIKLIMLNFHLNEFTFR